MIIETIDGLDSAYDEILRLEARKKWANEDFAGFANWIRPGLRVNKHHDILAKYLEAFAKGLIPRLMIFAPPRHGKSEYVSRMLPAYIYGNNPRANIIACSYSATLAQKMNRDVKGFMDSSRWEDIKPLWGIPKPRDRQAVAKRTAEEFEVYLKGDVSHIKGLEDYQAGDITGFYNCAGVNGPITGFGADFAIIDDPCKDAKEASSATYQAAIMDWYQSTFYTRLQDPGSVLIMHTRWDQNDLAGQLLRKAAEDPEADQWVVLNLPALYDDTLEGLVPEDEREYGQALWPKRFSEQRLKQIKNTVGPRWWNALYQGSPIAEEGSIFKKGWFKRYRKFEDFGGLGSLKDIVFSADLSFKGDHQNDYVVFQVWGKTHGADPDYILIDQMRGKWDFVETEDALDALRERYPYVKTLYLEDKANGSALGSRIRKRHKKGLKVIPVTPDTSKVLRYYAIQPIVKAGRVWIPANAHFTQDYLKELSSVRGSHTNKIVGSPHDDQADTTAQILLEWAHQGETDPLAQLKKLQYLSG